MLRRCVIAMLIGLPALAPAADSGARAALVNGVPLIVRVLEVRGVPQRLAVRMLQQWRRDPAVEWTHIETLPGRTVIAQRRGPLHITASLSAAQRPFEARVVVSVLDLRQPQRLPRWQVPVQAAGSLWVSVTEATPGVAEYLGFVPSPLPQARQGWVAALRRTGFTVTAPTDLQLEALGQGQVLSVFLMPVASGTSVVLQSRERPP